MLSLLMASDVVLALGIFVLLLLATPIGLLTVKFFIVAVKVAYQCLRAVLNVLKRIVRFCVRLFRRIRG